MTDAKSSSRSPWLWIPSLYFAEGLPYALAMSVSLVLYKNLGVSNAAAAFYTSWFYLPWVIKPLWSPVVDILKTRRQWIWVMQLLLGSVLAGVALTIPTTHFFQWTLMFFWLLAFNSATHDIAADGFYMLATTEREQAFYSGIRNTAYRVATICAQGLLVILAGVIQTHTSLPSISLQIKAESSVPFAEKIKPGQTNAIIGDQNQLHILAEPALIKINLRKRPKSEIETLLASAEAWNVKNGFRPAENRTTTRRVSWWTKHISQPVGEILERYFGPKTKTTGNMAGDIGFTRLSLSQPPSHEVVVIPVLKSDNVSIAEGSRLTFNATNWNKSALIAFQLDSKLKSPASTICKLRSGNIPVSWTTVFALIAGIILCLGLYHFFILPKPQIDRPSELAIQKTFLGEFIKTFGIFFRKPKITVLLLFLLLYRLGEAQLVKMVQPFLLDPHDAGGLGLTNVQLGLIYGTVGVIALLLGGLLGGFVVSRQGLKFWLWPMLLAIHLPDAVFIWLAYAQPEKLSVIGAGVALEQFGYGFGFTAFMLYMIYIARGEHRTAHYAICTGFMALGMMIPGLWSGWLQEHIGYPHFFTWVILATIPSFIVALKIPLDAEFGKRRSV